MAEGVRWTRRSHVLKQSKSLGRNVSQVISTRGPQVLRIDKARTSITTLTREARLWMTLSSRETHIVPLLDWGVREPDVILFLSPLLKSLSKLPEHRAVPFIRSVLATLARLQTPHANLGLHSVFFADNGRPLIGGFGATRVALLEAGATQWDDVRDVAALLYYLISEQRYVDGTKLGFDKCAACSTELKTLLRRILEEQTHISLLQFRYDLAAIHGYVPMCTVALPPTEAKRKKDTLLRADLNSVNGSISRRDAQLLATAAATAAAGGTSSTKRISRKHRAIEPPIAPIVTGLDSHNTAAPVPCTLANLSSVAAPVSAAVSTVIEELVYRLISPELKAMDNSHLNALIRNCSGEPVLVDLVFKTLFKRPLGKNPVVGFKAIILVHMLLSKGPPEMTSLAITHDGFLGWVEASWSRERIQSRPPQKAHRLSHCIAVGELSWYAAMLRRRCTFFSTYSALFSPHWNIRTNATAFTSNNHRAIRAALSVLEGAASVVKRIAASGDPLEPVKRGSTLALTSDVANAYHACCWLYCTAHPSVKQGMQEDLDSAHNAARSVFRVVNSAPHIAQELPATVILKLEDSPPRDFDLSTLFPSPAPSANGIKKQKKKPKQRIIDEQVQAAAGQPNTKQTEETREDSVDTEESREKRKYREKSKRKKEKLNSPSESMKNVDQIHSNSTVPSSVERIDEAASVLSKHSGEERQSPSSTIRGKQKRDIYSAVDEIDTESLGRKSKEKKATTNRKKSNRRKASSTRHKTDDDSSTDGEADESCEDSEDGSSDDSSEHMKRRTRKSAKKKGKTRNRSQRTKVEAAAEKVAPPPPRKAPVVVPPNSHTLKLVEANNREGSREALAAAASGKKTPQMNGGFEVAPYEVQFGQQIGSGGFGIVYKARFRGQTAAVKKIHGHALSNPASIAEFQSEVAVLCTLKHPNILVFMGACTKPPNLMIITEFMARGTLFDVLHQSQLRITWPMRRRFALDTCRGMRYLHDSKLLHRDLKSSNLMLDNDFACKVGDFGLTRTSAGTAAVQMTGQCGTFQYMAVEVLANKPYSEKADVFSFGILLWEMVARKLPYFGMQPMQVGIAVVQQGLRPTIPPRTPPPLSKLMRACWDSDPNRRPSFAQLVQMLEAMPE